ncbi:Long chronological lifespan protein 2 [Thecaphora frezii]
MPRTMTSTKPSLLVLSLLALLVAAATLAEAQFFENFFGGNGGGMFGGGPAHEPEAPPSGDASWFHDRVDAADCDRYLCPRTLSCVSKPSHCPCPFPQQIRCSYRDTDSRAAAIAKKSGGSLDGVEAQLDLGGTFCVTADSCDEVNAFLRGAGGR